MSVEGRDRDWIMIVPFLSQPSKSFFLPERSDWGTGEQSGVYGY